MIGLSAEKHRRKEAVNHLHSRCAAAAAAAAASSARFSSARFSYNEGTQRRSVGQEVLFAARWPQVESSLQAGCHKQESRLRGAHTAAWVVVLAPPPLPYLE